MVSAPQDFNIIYVEDFNRKLRFSTVKNLHTTPLCWKISVYPAKTRIAGFSYVIFSGGYCRFYARRLPRCRRSSCNCLGESGRIE